MGNVGKIVAETEIWKNPFQPLHRLYPARASTDLAKSLLSFVPPERRAIRSGATNGIQKNPFSRLYVAARGFALFVC